MPFKDHEKYKEWNRNRMRKKRAEEKDSKNFNDNIEALSIGLAILEQIQQDNPDLTLEQIDRAVTSYIKEITKKTDTATETLKDVSDWIYKHLDLKLIDIAGGTAC